MLLQLIRLDVAFQWALRLSAAVLGLQLFGLVFSPSVGIVMDMTCLISFVSLGFVQFQPRCGVMEVSLPIPARTIWLARVAALMMMVWLPILISFAAVSLAQTKLSETDLDRMLARHWA